MEVHFFATLRDIVGGKTVFFDVPPNATALQLIIEITRRYPVLQTKLFDSNGNLHNYVHYFINGRDVRYLDQGMDTIVDPKDVINIFPAVGGG